MKKKHHPLKILGMIGVFLVIGVLFLNIFNSSGQLVAFQTKDDTAKFIPFGQVDSNLPDDIDITNELDQCNDNPECENEITKLLVKSIVKSNNDFIQSNQTITEDFFDELEIEGLASDRFLFVSNIQKFTGDNQFIPETTIFDVQPALLTDSKGNILDLGAVQIGFFGVVKENGMLSYEAEVEFLLDNNIIAKKVVFASGTTENKRLKGDITDSFGSTTSPNFTFTFADEGKDWKDGETHVFKVKLKKIDAQITNNVGITKFYNWTGNFTAYNLQMAVDGNKIGIFNDSLDEVISVFKNDGVLVLGAGGVTDCSVPPVKLTVNINDVEGKLINSLSHDKQQIIRWERWDGKTMTTCSNKLIESKPFIPRQSELRISVNVVGDTETIQDSFTYISPKSQNNIKIECNQNSNTKIRCTSTIGWSYP